MASVICTECGTEVPDSAQECTECGFPFDNLLPVECPQCKKQVVFVGELCPECGFVNEYSAEGTADIPIDGALAAESTEPAADLPGVPSDGERDAEGVPQASHAPEGEAASGAPILEEEAAMEAPTQEEDAASLLRSMRDACTNPNDADYVVNVIAGHISAVKSDFVNNPMKAFVQILTELDKSSKEHQGVVQQGFDALGGVQDTLLASVAEIIQVTAQQSRESLSKSQELTLTIVSEINALKEAQGAAVAELSNRISQVPVQPVIAAAAPEGVPAADSTSEYVLYLCLAMLLFNILNFFITIYAVKLLK